MNNLDILVELLLDVEPTRLISFNNHAYASQLSDWVGSELDISITDLADWLLAQYDTPNDALIAVTTYVPPTSDYLRKHGFILQAFNMDVEDYTLLSLWKEYCQDKHRTNDIVYDAFDELFYDVMEFQAEKLSDYVLYGDINHEHRYFFLGTSGFQSAASLVDTPVDLDAMADYAIEFNSCVYALADGTFGE